ncbi:MAG: septum formation protein Maf [Actinobacteria bacterium RBG_16_64_13]|nr:MAG: septum formation protein Maf [Actinobacteria bacterium RBG_16_64_13]
MILASQSPRRHSLLRDVGVPFTVVPSAAVEEASGGSATALAERNALAKVAGACLPEGSSPGTFVLGTDTLVTIDQVVMGKPTSADEAAQMLTELSGRTHQVVSGVALARTAGGRSVGGGEQIQVASAVTDVTFLSLHRAQIDAYVVSGEWRGKAGAYAVQGLAGLFVNELRGEYSNVVGLPLCLLTRLFAESGFDLVRRTWL